MKNYIIKNKNNLLEHCKYNFWKILEGSVKGKIIKNNGNELSPLSRGINIENKKNNPKEKSN